MIDYLDEFPIPEAKLPERLRALLEPAGANPQLRVEVTARWDNDLHGPHREFVQMIMAAVPESALAALGIAWVTLTSGYSMTICPCPNSALPRGRFLPNTTSRLSDTYNGRCPTNICEGTYG